MMKMMKKHASTSIHHSQSPRSDCQGSIFGSVAAFSSKSSPTLSSMRTISLAVSPRYSSATKMLLIFGLLWSSFLTNQLALSINIDQNQSKNLILVDSSPSVNDDGPRQQQQKDIQNGPLSSSSAAASSSSPTSTASASSTPISSSSTSTLLAIKSLDSLLDQMNGEQFVEMFDQLMDGELSRIIGHIQTKTNRKLETIPANKFSAKQYINILDDYSSGLVSARLEQIVAKLAQLKQQQQQAGSSRPRRSSFDSLTGLSMGYSKRSFDAMGGASLGSPSKRSINFDEMDRSGFSGFAKRRSFGGGAAFDEIDNSGFAGFNKRRSLNDFDEMDHSGFAGFAKRYADFDEIDRSGFNSFAKRSADFDEMDHSGFVGFAKRHRPSSLLVSKRVNFDELDHSGFSGFSGYGKRYFISPIIDMINRAKLQAWAKQNKLQRSSNIHSERLK